MLEVSMQYPMDSRKYLRWTEDGAFVNDKKVRKCFGYCLMHDSELQKLEFEKWKQEYPGLKAVCMVPSWTPPPHNCADLKKYNIGGTKRGEPGPYLYYWLEFKDGTHTRPRFERKCSDGFRCVFVGFAGIMSRYTYLSEVVNSAKKTCWPSQILQKWVDRNYSTL